MSSTIQVEQSSDDLRIHVNRRRQINSTRRMLAVFVLNVALFIVCFSPAVNFEPGNTQQTGMALNIFCLYLVALVISLPFQPRLVRLWEYTRFDLDITPGAVSVTTNGWMDSLRKHLIGTYASRDTEQFSSLWLIFEDGEGVRVVSDVTPETVSEMETTIRKFCRFSDDVFYLAV